ncbi:hypothetical protein NKI80_00045 [Mesorhizobium sp. M0387]|uniref:hypothetical protein n=1 Tax=Mesorhizobium sp. M0387 TaxID=2956940 RepID=UPI00333D7FB3
MMELLRPWMLPGPAAFVARMCSLADRHKVVVLHAPFASASVAEALRHHIGREGRYSVIPVNLDAQEPFESSLAASAGLATSSSLAALVTSPVLQYAAIVVFSRGPPDSGLASFARMIARQPLEERPILLVVSEDGGCVLEGHALEPVRDVFGPLDGAAYAAALPRGGRPLEARLVASVAIEVAAWDVVLLDRLTALPPEQAVRPDLHLAAWDNGETARWRGMAPTWEKGCLDDWGGEPTEHVLWIAANRPSALAKRVWRGQLAMLLPWIEQYRQAIIEQEKRNLRPDITRSGPDIESLDWGPLAFQLDRVPNVKRLAHAFREARNELAHGRPILWSHVRLCIDAARAWRR